MDLHERVLREAIYIDFGAEILYDSDEVDLYYPARFATVGFELLETASLREVADEIRREQGLRNVVNGWYDFYIGINEYTRTKCDTELSFVVADEEAYDDGKQYKIDLSEKDQEIIYNILDEQCQKYLEKSCEELLRDANKEMNGGT